MAQIHHPPLFSSAWLELHPAFLPSLRRAGLTAGSMGLLFGAASLVTGLESALPLSTPLQVSPVLDRGGSPARPELPVAGEYLPDRFREQIRHAVEAEFPPQF